MTITQEQEWLPAVAGPEGGLNNAKKQPAAQGCFFMPKGQLKQVYEWIGTGMAPFGRRTLGEGFTNQKKVPPDVGLFL